LNESEPQIVLGLFSLVILVERPKLNCRYRNRRFWYWSINQKEYFEVLYLYGWCFWNV